MSTAQLNKYRQSPRKVRLIADMARGKKVKEILPILDGLSKRAAEPVKKLILSAVANAIHNENLDKDSLVISEIRVDESATLKRSRPRARGRAFPIRKRTSRIMIRLTEQVTKGKEVVAEDITKEEKSADVKSSSADKKDSGVTKKTKAKDSIKDKDKTTK